MTSDPVFVWVWLPGEIEPVVAGRLDPGQAASFVYARSYMERSSSIALAPEIPLGDGRIMPAAGLTIPGCILDGAPDSWGKRVILHRRSGASTRGRDTAQLDEFTYLLESGSNRIGAFDFQASSAEYVSRMGGNASIADLMSAADKVAAGEQLPEALDQALLHGSSVGGARPKATLFNPETGRQVIAKFSSSTDQYPVVKAEGVAMRLAAMAGVATAATEVVEVMGRDVLLVDRFDRGEGDTRRMMVSLLTMLELDEMAARHATYHEFADLIRTRFTDPEVTLAEVFRRIVVNIAVSNTDDHARNHAAFWDGRMLSLTPAYDVCPQLRSGGYTEQAMAIGRDGAKAAEFSTCVAAADVFLLDRAEATVIVDEVVNAVRSGWSEAVEHARLTDGQAELMWERQVLNPAVFH